MSSDGQPDSNRRSYTRTKVTPMPERIETKLDRGRALLHWLDSNGYTADDFAKLTGISYSTITSYAQGKIDLATMQQHTAEKFIPKLGMSDEEAWAYFNIPEANREKFRSFRSSPNKSTPPAEQQVLLTLRKPLRGTLTLNPGDAVKYDPNVKDSGRMLIKLEDGSYLTLDAESAGNVGEVLGELVSISLKRPKRRSK